MGNLFDYLEKILSNVFDYLEDRKFLLVIITFAVSFFSEYGKKSKKKKDTKRKNIEVFKKDDIKNKKYKAKQKNKSFDRLDDFLGKNIKNSEKQSQYVEDFLGDVQKNYYKEEEKFVENVFGVESVKQKEKVRNTKNNMKQNIYKASKNTKIDDIRYDYEKDNKIKHGYDIENEISDYGGYEIIEDDLYRQEFVFDAKSAVIYSEILQKPLALR